MPSHTRRLDPEDALRTYALARLAAPELTLSEWEARLAQTEGRGGVYAHFDNDTPRALLGYTRAADPDGAELLVIDWVAAFDLLSPDTVAERLIGAFRDRHSSRPVRIAWSPRPPSAMFDGAVARASSLHSVL